MAAHTNKKQNRTQNNWHPLASAQATQSTSIIQMRSDWGDKTHHCCITWPAYPKHVSSGHRHHTACTACCSHSMAWLSCSHHPHSGSRIFHHYQPVECKAAGKVERQRIRIPIARKILLDPQSEHWFIEDASEGGW